MKGCAMDQGTNLRLTGNAIIAALLHSADSEWINGQVIDVNGGLLLRS
jgi:hypothetical protein